MCSWLCWVFAAVRGLLSGQSGGHSVLQYAGFSSRRLLSSQSMGSTAQRLQQLWSRSSRTQAQQPRGMGSAHPQHVGSSQIGD